MPLFVVIGHDIEDSSEKRKQVRPKHVARLKALNEAGRVVLAGPCPQAHDDADAGMTGSVMILDFDSLAEIEAWLKEEPYLLEGVYSHVDVKPFIQVLPN